MFDSVADLSQLKYFKLNPEGRHLEYIGPGKDFIDFHTHVGGSYLFGHAIDWFSECDTQTYFPFWGKHLDMDQYSAYSFDRRMTRRTRWESLRPAVHNRGIARTHTFPNLLREMEYLKFSRSVVLAIDVFDSRNSDRLLNYQRFLKDKFTLFASVDPKFRSAPRHLLRHLKNGASGLKLHPVVQTIRPNNPKVVRLCRMMGEYNLPVILHCGWGPLVPKWQQKFTNLDDYADLVKKCPDTTIILGHAGSGQYQSAIKIAAQNPRVYLELSGQTPASIREILSELGDDRLLFGSDWPYYPIAWPLAKVLLATEGRPRSRTKILRTNAQKLLHLTKNPAQK